MKFAPVVSLAIVVGLACYFLGLSAPSTPAQSGWSGVPTVDQLMGRNPGPLAVSHPRNWVIIREPDGPYTVPADMILVLTALGDQTGKDDGIYLKINGVQEVKRTGYGSASSDTASPTVHALPTGLSAGPGSVVTVSSSFTRGRAWGYLVDA